MIFILLLIIISILVYKIRLIYQVSSSPFTKNNSLNKGVLLVIDMQNDTVANQKYYNINNTLYNINKAIDKALKQDIDVIYIKQEYVSLLYQLIALGKYRKGYYGANLSPLLMVASNHIFTKERADAFSNVLLDEFIYQKAYSTIYLVGADALACVYKSALASLNRGYDTIIIKDCLCALSPKQYHKALSNYKVKGIDLINLKDFSDLY
ncbi:MAG: cysteine hydrolase [Bacilli bacterium]